MKRLRHWWWGFGMWCCRLGLHDWTVTSWREPYSLYVPIFGAKSYEQQSYEMRGSLMVTGLRCKRCDLPHRVGG